MTTHFDPFRPLPLYLSTICCFADLFQNFKWYENKQCCQSSNGQNEQKSVSPSAFCLTPTKKPKGVRLNRLMMLTAQAILILDRAGGIYVPKMSISATMYYSIREKAKTKMADATSLCCNWPVTILFSFIKLHDGNKDSSIRQLMLKSGDSLKIKFLI